MALHLLLPDGARVTGVTWGGEASSFTPVTVEASPYVDATGRVDGKTTVEVTYG